MMHENKALQAESVQAMARHATQLGQLQQVREMGDRHVYSSGHSMTQDLVPTGPGREGAC